MEFGMATVAAITVICYLVGLAVKAGPETGHRYIPVIVGFVGGVLGLVALMIAMPDFPAGDPLSAAAVGIVSGLAATGIDQAVKQVGK